MVIAKADTYKVGIDIPVGSYLFQAVVDNGSVKLQLTRANKTEVMTIYENNKSVVNLKKGDIIKADNYFIIKRVQRKES